jgi:DNA-binding NarL/FixJ family response regulator
MAVESPDGEFVLLRVLVADSGCSVNDGLTALLSEIDGISVFGCAQQQGQVLTLARSLCPDVIILDVQLQEPCRLTVIRRLKALPYVPIVIGLYDSDLGLFKEAAFADGADHVFARTDCEGLLRLLTDIIGERS